MDLFVFMFCLFFIFIDLPQASVVTIPMAYESYHRFTRIIKLEQIHSLVHFDGHLESLGQCLNFCLAAPVASPGHLSQICFEGINLLHLLGRHEVLVKFWVFPHIIYCLPPVAGMVSAQLVS